MKSPAGNIVSAQFWILLFVYLGLFYINTLDAVVVENVRTLRSNNGRRKINSIQFN